MTLDLCLCVSLTLVITAVIFTNGILPDDTESALQSENVITTGIRMKVYTGSSIEDATITDIPLDRVEDVMYYIDLNKPLALYVHGFQEHPSNESVRTVVGAYLLRGDHNIIALDWSDFAYRTYIMSVLSTAEMGKLTAQSLEKLGQLGLDLSRLHIVAHSMGAQISGFIGKFSNFVVPRITALDPAGPGFYMFGAEHLNSTDAEFVDVIHTDGGIYGALEQTGTVDFFANGGNRPQPGCPLFGVPLTETDLCSHWRSWRFYAESLLNEQAFLAIECRSYAEFLTARYCGRRKVYAGYPTPMNTRGTYYFNTGSKYPFGKGTKGIGMN